MTAFIQLRVVLLCGLLGYPVVACGKGKEGVSVMVPEQASRGELVEMAVKVRPSARQLDYQQREMLGFIHFGMNTFTGAEWGKGGACNFQSFPAGRPFLGKNVQGCRCNGSDLCSEAS